MPSETTIFGGTMMIQRVRALKGSKHRKKHSTTVANIMTTCLRYLSRLFAGPRLIAGFAIRCLAITVYSTIRINSGVTKNTRIVVRMKPVIQVVEAGVVQVEIKQAEERVVIDRGYLLGGRYHDVEDEESIGRKAYEEAHDYRQQHVHHLPPGPAMIRVAGRRRRRVADQVTHDKRIQYHEYHKWGDEEEQHQ